MKIIYSNSVHRDRDVKYPELHRLYYNLRYRDQRKFFLQKNIDRNPSTECRYEAAWLTLNERMDDGEQDLEIPKSKLPPEDPKHVVQWNATLLQYLYRVEMISTTTCPASS